MAKIIRKNLAAFVSNAIDKYRSSGEEMHIAIVSAIYNTATSGDVTLLNRINENLRSNDQQALRLYVRRISIANGLVLTNGPADVEVLDTASMEKMLKEGGIFGYSKGKFTCLKNPATAAAKSLATLCEKRFVNPDGKRDRFVFERNNFAEHKILGDAEVLKSVLKTINEALNNSTENKTFNLSSAIKDRLTKVRDMLEVNHKQATLNEG